MNKKLSTLIGAVTAALLCAFTAICVCFFPNFAAYLDEFLCENGRPIENAPLIVCVVGTILTLPCAAILVMALRLPSAVANDGIFTRETASLLARIARILCIDCILFLCAVIALFAVGESVVAPLLALIDLIGFALAFLLHVLADYVRRAAALKEEVDCTL